MELRKKRYTICLLIWLWLSKWLNTNNLAMLSNAWQWLSTVMLSNGLVYMVIGLIKEDLTINNMKK
jgi:hypothetical protein